jgi:hypothetical protein
LEKPDKNVELLVRAVERNTAIAVSLPSAGMYRNHKTRFLCEVDGGILIQAPRGEDALIRELIDNAAPCRVAFVSGSLEIGFQSAILRMEKHWPLNPSTVVSALLLEFPAGIEAKRRRSSYRVDVLPDSGVLIRVWRLSEEDSLAPQPSATREVTAEIRDLSTSGVGVKFIGKDGARPIVGVEDRLRVALTHNEQTFIMEGKMRRPTGSPRGNSIITGIHFRRLEGDFEGRKKLARLIRVVGQLQREEVRRVRLGLSAKKAS